MEHAQVIIIGGSAKAACLLLSAILLAAAQPPRSKPVGPKWRISRSKSPMEDSQTVVLSLPAENLVRGWLKSYRPALFIRCQEGETDAYVDLGMSPNPTLGLYWEHPVRLRFDDLEPHEETWKESTSGDALFSPNAVEFADRLAHSRRLLFEFTPYRSSPAIARFDVPGLAPHLVHVARACGWYFQHRDKAWEKAHPLKLEFTALDLLLAPCRRRRAAARGGVLQQRKGPRLRSQADHQSRSLSGELLGDQRQRRPLEARV